MKQQLPNSLSPFIWHFLKSYKLIAFFFVFLAILAGFWGPFNNILIKHIINILPEVPDNGISLLTWPAILIVLNFIIFDNITWRTIDYIFYKYLAKIKNQIISETLDSVLGSSHQFFQDNLSGRLANQITTLSDNIEHILQRISLDFIRGTSLLFMSFITAYFVNPLFFYVLFLWFIAFSIFSIFMSARLVNLANIHANSESVVSGQLVDLISNSSNIRIFSKKSYEISRIAKFLFTSEKAFQSKELFILFLYSVQGLMIATMMGFAVYFLIYLYSQGSVSIGDFALILGLSMELGHMMWYTMSRVDEFNEAVGKCNQSLLSLITKPEITDKSTTELLVTKGEIVFKEVKFHYKGTKPLFENLSIEIKAGEKVGLVGFSGSGKSTFVSLILRLYDVTDGSILIDGQDIKNVTQKSLRHNIGLIPQDPSLFHRSVMDNIRYGKIEALDEEVFEATRKAHAFEFISKMSQGYDALVGEKGVKLSGGQRQRIAIARAILKDAPILILDEATSQLDSITESHIQESLWDLMEDKTTLVIAHRLSTLLHMDRILVFDHGKIVQDGSHEDLLTQGGLYKVLWDAQVGGLLPENINEDEEEDEEDYE